MIIKQIRDEDFTNYRLPSMVVGFPKCTFKCEKDCGVRGMCQNLALFKSDNIEIEPIDIVNRYMSNPITRAMVFGGLEPFDTFEDMVALISTLRKVSKDTVVIYTGYYKNEIPNDQITLLRGFGNIIIKWGRFIPNQESHYDSVLGINLKSENQYAERL
jgi:hypothetical protein